MLFRFPHLRDKILEMDTNDLKTKIESFLNTILTSLGQEGFTLESEVTEDPEVYAVSVAIKGEQVDLLIGFHGKNLNAFHDIVLLFIKRSVGKMDKKISLFLDIGDYYAKQNEKMMEQVVQAISDVRLLQEPYEFNAMTPRMRRLVHMEVSKHSDIRSESIGEGESRRVVIHPQNVPAV